MHEPNVKTFGTLTSQTTRVCIMQNLCLVRRLLKQIGYHFSIVLEWIIVISITHKGIIFNYLLSIYSRKIMNKYKFQQMVFILVCVPFMFYNMVLEISFYIVTDSIWFNHCLFAYIKNKEKNQTKSLSGSRYLMTLMLSVVSW